MPDDLEKPYCTKNNFPFRFSDSLGSDPSMLSGYLQAIDTIFPGFKRIIEAVEKSETAEKYDELKKELLNYINEHIEFRDDIDEKWNSDNPEQYGLPKISRPDFT